MTHHRAQQEPALRIRTVETDSVSQAYRKAQGALFRGHRLSGGLGPADRSSEGGGWGGGWWWWWWPCSQVLKKWPLRRGVCGLPFSEGSGGSGLSHLGRWGLAVGPQPLPPPPINGLICMPCCGPVASGGRARSTWSAPHRTAPAWLPAAAMAWRRLALLLIGALLAGELALGLAPWGGVVGGGLGDSTRSRRPPCKEAS